TILAAARILRNSAQADRRGLGAGRQKTQPPSGVNQGLCRRGSRKRPTVQRPRRCRNGWANRAEPALQPAAPSLSSCRGCLALACKGVAAAGVALWGSKMDKLYFRVALSLLQLPLIVGALVFLPAWTFDYVQAWLFTAVFFACSLAITVYLAVKDPNLLERRMRAGPGAETEPSQKVIMAVALLAVGALPVVSAIDHRLAWSQVPLSIVIFGDLRSSWPISVFTSSSVRIPMVPLPSRSPMAKRLSRPGRPSRASAPAGRSILVFLSRLPSSCLQGCRGGGCCAMGQQNGQTLL